MASQQHALENLVQLTVELKREEKRWSSDDELRDVISILTETAACLNPLQSSHSPHSLKICLQSLRCLRNACAGCQKNQDHLLSTDIPELLKRLINETLHVIAEAASLEEDILALLRCSIQVAVNMVTENSQGQLCIWEIFYPGTLMGVLTCKDTKARHYGCMLILACLKHPEIMTCFETSDGRLKLVEEVLKICTEETELDFSLQLVTFLLHRPYFVPDSLANLDPDARMILLEIISAHLSEQAEDDTRPSEIGENSVQVLAEAFEKDCHQVFKFATGEEQESSDFKLPIVVIKLLSALCIASSSPTKPEMKILQERTSLLISSLELLHMVHAASKEENNLFTVTQSLAGDCPSENPVHGFRRDLVRLIGNLSYRCKKNQDLVRDLKGIQVILEQCNIDDQNPFINQWAILAIRNLCEDNLENQNVIASLRNQGVADNDTLRSFGYQAVMREDGTLYLQNVKKR